MKAEAADRSDGPPGPKTTGPTRPEGAKRLTPALVARVLQARDAVSQGRTFEDATEIIRQSREARAEAFCDGVRS